MKTISMSKNRQMITEVMASPLIQKYAFVEILITKTRQQHQRIVSTENDKTIYN